MPSSHSSTNVTTTSSTQAPDGIRRRLTSRLKFSSFRWADKDIDIPKSPLRHLLKSNVTPSDSEIITIRDLISDAEHRIGGLHHRSPTHNPTSQATESQLLKFIEAHKALLSPVRYLPSEILQEIFLHYAGDRVGVHAISGSSRWRNLGLVAMMPWRLGHICHRWRQISLSLPSLWDDIPKIDIGHESLAKRSNVQAYTQVMRRSGASPTLKFTILWNPYAISCTGHSIIGAVVFHSERIEKLHIEVTPTIMQTFQGLKGRLPNLRMLCLGSDECATTRWPGDERQSIDIFETAPVLRQVILTGSYPGDKIKLLLPWSQITYFEDRARSNMVELPQYVPVSSLCSLTALHIKKAPLTSTSHITHPTSYNPTLLPGLRTLCVEAWERHIGIRNRRRRYLCSFFDCLTIPAIEVITISYWHSSLVPNLISMFSRSHQPSQLQKLAFRTASLQPGELSSLLKFTPQLIELDIWVPPVEDLLSLTHREGEHILVPMLQALYMHCDPRKSSSLGHYEAEYFSGLARVRSELNSKDSGPEQNTLDMFIDFGYLGTTRFENLAQKHRDYSQRILNGWSPPSLNTDEKEALSRCIKCYSNFQHGEYFREVRNDYQIHSLDTILAWAEQCKGITNKVLRETNVHVYLRDLIGSNRLKIPSEDICALKWQQARHILEEWDRLLLNDLDGYRWAKTSPEWGDELGNSLVYLPKHKNHALRMSPDALSIAYGLKPGGAFKKPGLWVSVQRPPEEYASGFRD